eukprot:superscaffoldBa00002940_g15694
MKLAESKRWCRWSRCHGCFFILVVTVVVFYYNTNIKETAHDWSPKWWTKYNATKWFIPFNSHNNVFPNVSDPSTPGSTPELTTAAGLTTIENLSTFPQTENITEITSRTVADTNTPHQTENSSPVTQQITQKKNVRPTPIPYVSPGPYVVEYPYDYHFIINESKKCEEQKPFLVLIVPVAPNNKAHRDIIRRTWGNQSEVQGKVVKLFFLLGMHSGDGVEQVQEQVQQESKEHQDLIQSNFVDCYKNLTIKTMMMLEWLDSYCSDASYAMKIDSDTFLNLPLLINMLSNAPKTNYMTGLVAGNAAVLRDPSNYVTELMDLLFNEVVHDPAPFVAELKAVAVPGFLCSQYERPEKADAIDRHVSRFSCPGGVGNTVEQTSAALSLGQLQLVQVPVTTVTVEGFLAIYVDASTANKDPVICHTLPLPEDFQVKHDCGLL